MPNETLEAAIREVFRVERPSKAYRVVDSNKLNRAVSQLKAAIEATLDARMKASLAKVVSGAPAAVRSPKARRQAGLGRASALETLDHELGGGLPAAVEAGEAIRDAIWSRSDMLSSDEAAKRVNMSREALNRQRQARKVLGLEATKRGVRYPQWQFEDRVRPNVAPLLAALSHLDAWGHYLFFTQAEPLLRGQTPLHVLRTGSPKEVLRVGHLLAKEAHGE